uniref:Uncharacterized protein n=1 Tax=Rangifer tarandus platyrhynchus TaxID=3082113 RepID=A0ACB0F8F9_RANTA|nr:unnamed protein product [Rangifer tarandus platyrhynchus]
MQPRKGCQLLRASGEKADSGAQQVVHTTTPAPARPVCQSLSSSRAPPTADGRVPETERERLSPQRHWSAAPSWPTSLPVRGLCRLFSLWGFLLPNPVTWRLFSPLQKSEVLCWGSVGVLSALSHMEMRF